jgi:hypothetical protein
MFQRSNVADLVHDLCTRLTVYMRDPSAARQIGDRERAIQPRIRGRTSRYDVELNVWQFGPFHEAYELSRHKGPVSGCWAADNLLIHHRYKQRSSATRQDRLSGDACTDQIVNLARR